MPAPIPSPATSAPQSGLLNLPLELKEMIFRHLLVARGAINPELLKVKRFLPWWMQDKRIDCGIMNVSQKLNDAAATVLYRYNTFRFWAPAEAHRFAKLENAKQARSFVFVIEDPTWTNWCTYFEGNTPGFSYRNDFLRVKDLKLFFVRTESEVWSGMESDIQWEVRKLGICDALIRNIKVSRNFCIRDMNTVSSSSREESGLETLVKRAMKGENEYFEQYQHDTSYVIQQYVDRV